ncbi:hypothetical protein L1987_46339 [Smallanthus sonchifolius]|uniref:Uncharacterized protein n=1 Tax=Smallanthus sonchifolius TaxID=185202 RepID=A0ACB9G0G0_9ASTR|nr:hypothetical protein L1987_46339 [Smallanthus sonchifolius]
MIPLKIKEFSLPVEGDEERDKNSDTKMGSDYGEEDSDRSDELETAMELKFTLLSSSSGDRTGDEDQTKYEAKETVDQNSGKLMTVKFKVEEVPTVSLFKRHNSSKATKREREGKNRNTFRFSPSSVAVLFCSSGCLEFPLYIHNFFLPSPSFSL